MTITGFLTLAALNVTNPEALVARTSIARAGVALQLMDSLSTENGAKVPSPRATSPIDYGYLTRRLGGDAASEVVRALAAAPAAVPGTAARDGEVRARCDAVRSLLTRWGSKGNQVNGDWRRWNAGAWRAQRAVQSHERELRAVTCWDGGEERPFGAREQRAALPSEQWYRAPASP
jgi:hypothetical protein